ncbi:GvpL/GvpF family gas vesicle protein [Eilatimonas milleporae]|uniref:Gas vesicle protein GvpL/GvpF n=1 Tax=Eilatimonas milleporae TaxID=911205 RepID=A0A3M0CTS5_9PROT|nr:GvpL/GvpF family gas vesicle protein [Eilatimonas milleporae]RMB12375.1 gas vesicle protein GvpL/GvpF [Eilatimonas milleporae]
MSGPLKNPLSKPLNNPLSPGGTGTHTRKRGAGGKAGAEPDKTDTDRTVHDRTVQGKTGGDRGSAKKQPVKRKRGGKGGGKRVTPSRKAAGPSGKKPAAEMRGAVRGTTHAGAAQAPHPGKRRSSGAGASVGDGAVSGEDTLVYVYGVVRTDTDRAGAAPGVDMLNGPDILTGDCQGGDGQRGDGQIVGGGRVRLIAGDGLGAVVSGVPAAVFGAGALPDRLKDSDWARARVLDHHRVLMAVTERMAVAGAALLPFKFCSLFSGDAAVLRALDARRADLQAALATLDGAREWGVKLFADRAVLTRHTLATAPHLAALGKRVRAASPGTAFFLKRKLDEMARETADKAAGAHAGAIHRAVAEAARDAAIQPVQPPDLHGRGEEMILNAAYLVTRQAEGAFHGAVAALARRYGQAGLHFDIIGPLPPYSFATIDAKPDVSPNAGPNTGPNTGEGSV